VRAAHEYLHWKGVLPVGATTARMRVAVTLMVAL
jgi:hypothetical protein